jgi:hypothetical protein
VLEQFQAAAVGRGQVDERDVEGVLAQAQPGLAEAAGDDDVETQADGDLRGGANEAHVVINDQQDGTMDHGDLRSSSLLQRRRALATGVTFPGASWRSYTDVQFLPEGVELAPRLLGPLPTATARGAAGSAPERHQVDAFASPDHIHVRRSVGVEELPDRPGLAVAIGSVQSVAIDPAAQEEVVDGGGAPHG